LESVLGWRGIPGIARSNSNSECEEIHVASAKQKGILTDWKILLRAYQPYCVLGLRDVCGNQVILSGIRPVVSG
jgi:hypothetical protein